MISAARSPMITRGAMVLPVVTRHNGPIGNAKVVDAVNLEIAIDYGHHVTPHLGGRSLMPKARRCIADVVFQHCPFQFTRQDFPLQEWVQHVEAAKLSTKFYAL